MNFNFWITTPLPITFYFPKSEKQYHKLGFETYSFSYNVQSILIVHSGLIIFVIVLDEIAKRIEQSTCYSNGHISAMVIYMNGFVASRNNIISEMYY